MRAWHRFWQVTPWIVGGHWDYRLLFALAPQWTHLRTFVSWYVESAALYNLPEPIFAGVQAVPGGVTPNDPGGIGLGSGTDWWRGEVHYGRELAQRDGSVSDRVVWPANGSGLWDIETNRRTQDGEQLDYYFVWSGARDVQFVFRANLYWATLVDDHGQPG